MRHLFFFLWFLPLGSGQLFSQSIEELEAKLKFASAEEKPVILNQLSEASLKTNPDKSIDYAEQALKAARKIDDIDGETGALINLGDAYTATKNQKKALENYKDAIKIFDQYNQPASFAYIWNKISIGTSTNCSFDNNTVQVKEGDMIYLYSDGYQDQIGGKKRKKFLAYHFKELLQQIHTFEPEKQKEELEKEHNKWRAKNDQTDDILILGLKI